MSGWTYFSSTGEQVRATDPDAAFKARAVATGNSFPGPPDSAAMAHWEYHDFHAIGRPDHKRYFRTLRELKDAIAEAAKKA